jgi:hypothetical protein
VGSSADAAVDAATGAVDAPGDAAGAPDAPPVPLAPPTAEITSGGTRTSGAVYRMDVQVGHWSSQQPATGGGTRIEGASAIKP